MTITGTIARPSGVVYQGVTVLFEALTLDRKIPAGTPTKKNFSVVTNSSGVFTTDITPGVYQVRLNTRDIFQILVPTTSSGTKNITELILKDE